jgi:Domain of unknown function (DUF3471)
VRLEIHPLVFLVGSLLLCTAWLSLRPAPPAPTTQAAAFRARAAAHASEHKTIELPQEVLQRYVGAYRIDATIAVAIELDGGRLFAAATDTPRYELRPTSETEFYLPDLDADLAFELDAAGQAASFAVRLPTGTIVAKRAR